MSSVVLAGAMLSDAALQFTRVVSMPDAACATAIILLLFADNLL